MELALLYFVANAAVNISIMRSYCGLVSVYVKLGLPDHKGILFSFVCETSILLDIITIFCFTPLSAVHCSSRF